MNWQYKNNDQVVGPLSEGSMKELHACGLLAGETLVRREGTEEWLPFDKAFEKRAAPPELLIKFHCPKCDTKIAAGLEDAGNSADCPSCGISLVVPLKAAGLTESTDASKQSSAISANISDSQFATDDSAMHEFETNEVMSHSALDPINVASGEVSPIQKFGTTLASFAKSAAHEVKLNSQIAVLKTRIENAKQIELRKAHYALGRKLYKARILLSMQEEIEELERQIAEKGERAVIEENETKGAMLKRVGKNAAKSAESELLSLKLKQLLTHLGELARGAHQEASFPGAETEMESCSAVESKIRNCEEQISSVSASRKKVTLNALPNNVPQPIRENVMDLQNHSAKSAEDSERSASIDRSDYYEEAQSNISGKNLPATASTTPLGWRFSKFPKKNFNLRYSIGLIVLILCTTVIVVSLNRSNEKPPDVSSSTIIDSPPSSMMCMRCKGSGGAVVSCTQCRGSRTMTTSRGFEIVCPKCGGGGAVRIRCAGCGGAGKVKYSRENLYAPQNRSYNPNDPMGEYN
jgi:hypothetical protein